MSGFDHEGSFAAGIVLIMGEISATLKVAVVENGSWMATRMGLIPWQAGRL